MSENNGQVDTELVTVLTLDERFEEEQRNYNSLNAQIQGHKETLRQLEFTITKSLGRLELLRDLKRDQEIEDAGIEVASDAESS